MGGAVARATFLARNYVDGSVNTILTLSAPHTAGPLMTERAVADFYSQINGFWASELRSNSSSKSRLSDVAVLSLAGGFRDVQVAAELSTLESISPRSHQISVLSSSIPHVWLSVDHLACVWCNQVMAALTRTLVALVDPATKQISRSQRERMSAMRSIYDSSVPEMFRLRYAPRTRAEYLKSQKFEPSTLTRGAKTIIEPLFALVGASAVKPQQRYRWRLSQMSQDDQFIVHTSLLGDEIAILGCKETTSMTATGSYGPDECVALESLIVPIPSRLTQDTRAWISEFSRNWLGARLFVASFEQLSSLGLSSIIIATSRFQEHASRELLLVASISRSHQESPSGLSFLHSEISVPTLKQGHPVLLNYSIADAHKLVSSNVVVKYGACHRSPGSGHKICYLLILIPPLSSIPTPSCANYSLAHGGALGN